jgi:DNA-binding response OmpR family regulator
MLQPSILLVEDDAFQRKAAETYLMNHDLKVIAVENGAQMRRQISRAMPDLVLLDVQLPGQEDGFALARWLRESSTRVGIIMLTAAGDSVDKVLGLESGADDYLPKPFSARELLARIRALVRRARGRVGPAPERALATGGLVLNPKDYSASLDGQPLRLTTAEFHLLRAFAERPGRVLSREQLLDLTKGSAEEAFDRSIDAHISHLRQKLGDNPKNPRLLKTVRGIGYLLTEGGRVGEEG